MKKEPMKNVLKKAFTEKHREGYFAGHKVGYTKGRNDGISTAVENYSSVVLFCLKDKFDFNNEELKLVTAAINETFHSVCDGYLTFEDIRDTMQLENNLEISFTEGDVNLKESVDDESLPLA